MTIKNQSRYWHEARKPETWMEKNGALMFMSTNAVVRNSKIPQSIGVVRAARGDFASTRCPKIQSAAKSSSASSHKELITGMASTSRRTWSTPA